MTNTRGGRGRGQTVVGAVKRHHNAVRHVRTQAKHRVKLREATGFIQPKQQLSLGLLNVDGLSPSSFEDVRTVLLEKSLDVCFLLETKRRYEEQGSDISVPGYDVHEVRRSDVAEDRSGGGIA